VSAVLEEDEVDGRMVRLESDVAHMRSDTSNIKTDIRELRAEARANWEELSGVRVEIEKLRDELHTRLAAVRADLYNELAAVRAEMHSADERLHRTVKGG